MKKLKNESGSALILALFLMILVSILIISFSNQVANQIRSTINLDKDMQEMYEVESNIEKFIKYFIEGISIDYNEEIKDYEIKYKTSGCIKKDEEVVSECENENEDEKKVIMKMTATEIKTTETEQVSSNIENRKFQLDITELNNEGDSDDIKSCIEVNISRTKGNETCNIDYGVVSWRIRN